MKKMKNYFMLFIGICLAFYWGCKKDETTNNKGTKQVKIDNVATINFPDGSIATTNPTVDKVSDADIQSTFNETADLFNVGNTLSYQVKISIGNQPPNNDEVEVILNLPSDFLAQKPQTNGIELFALTYQNGGEETLDNFELISSTYSSTNKTLTAQLPRWVFTNSRNGNYETVLTIASTPDGNTKKSLKSGNEVTEDCLASQISCPTGSCEVTSPYNPQRLHPVDIIIKPHWGTDYRAPVGSPVYAVADGKVIRVHTQVDISSNVIGYGLYIVIRHDNQKGSTLYAHLSSTSVTVGQTVKQGEQIALSGNTGTTDGPHLHFEYVPSGEIVKSKYRINPFPCITAATLASITTVSATNITANSATSGGNISSDGGASFTAHGVCWSTSANPTTALTTKTSDGTGTGVFTSSLTGLTANTTYYVRAYASNSAGTAYGSETSFTTLRSLTKPSLSTTSASYITRSTAISGGNITDDGGAPITARGVCWSTFLNPTISDAHNSEGSGTGVFTSNIIGLTANTIYIVRAYATNSAGTAYGNNLIFATTSFDIGQIYGGGMIFYLYDTGQHGLIAALGDLSNGVPWYPDSKVYGSAGYRYENYGGGRRNTEDIVNLVGPGNYAARLCYDLVLNGESDWYLPNTTELARLFNLQNLIGGFSKGKYWTSSLSTTYYLGGLGGILISADAFLYDFSSGGSIGSEDTKNSYSVRAIRYF